jgi:hypothetical protein
MRHDRSWSGSRSWVLGGLDVVAKVARELVADGAAGEAPGAVVAFEGVVFRASSRLRRISVGKPGQREQAERLIALTVAGLTVPVSGLRPES